jgi:hypothetical protein
VEGLAKLGLAYLPAGLYAHDGFRNIKVP